MNKNAPCLNCRIRFPSCHGKCYKYKEWKKERDEINAEIRKVNDAENELNAIKIDGVERWNKRIK